MRQRRAGVWKCRHKDAAIAVFLAALSFFFCWFFIARFGIFGSKVDWISQHSVIPDYFRQQFYDTGEFFPEFAPNIGGGQNIYNFSYYGLYSPIILLSYLLPFVKMGDYIMASSMCMAALSAVLFYLWLHSRGFSRTICFWSALMLELSGPVIFHSSRHVMFVNYMPFLILALWGIDRYFGAVLEASRSLHQTFYGSPWLYIGSVFLMILTSFYFSVGGILVLCIYGVHRYAQVLRLRKRQEAQAEQGAVGNTSAFFRGIAAVWQLGKDAAAFLLPLVTAVCMSAFLLVPTAYALIGKRETSQGLSVAALLTPDFYDFRLFYHPYGIGLTALAGAALISGLCWRRAENRILIWSCIAVLLLPVFPWILNGGLYPRDKALIPFLPLLCYVIALYVKRLQESERRASVVPYMLVIALLLWESGLKISLLLLDAFVMLICCLFFRLKRNVRYLIIPPAVCLALFGISFHGAGNIESRSFYDRVTDEHVGEAIREVLAKEEGFYRMEQCGTYAENMADVDRIWDMDQYSSSIYASSYHDGYRGFCQETFGIEQPTRNALIQQVSQNPSFRHLMGVKYIVMHGEEEQTQKRQKAQLLASGYELCYDKNGVQIYENETVAPIGYMAKQVITQEAYELLPFPYNQIVLEYVAVADSSDEKKEEGYSKEKVGQIKEQLSGCVREISLFFPEEQEKAWSIIPVNEPKTNTYSENEYFKVANSNRESRSASENDESVTGKSENKNIYSKNAEIKVGYYKADSLYVKTEKTKVVQVMTDETDIFDQPWILYLQFTVKNAHPSSELSVSVEGVQNKLSSSNHLYKNENTVFTYAVPMQAGQKEIELTLGKGEYELLDIACFARQEPCLEQEREGEAAEAISRPYGKEEWDRWMPDNGQTAGEKLTGTVRARETGWFVTSIPYDESFEVFVDGTRTSPRLVNTAFLGFLLPKGTHTVTFVYHAPGLAAGKALAFLGSVLCVLQLMAGWRRMAGLK